MAFQITEKVFKTLIENSSDMLAVSGPDFTTLYASPAYARVLGYTMDEVLGKPATDFIHPDDLPKLAEVNQRIMREPGASGALHIRYKKKNGGWAYVDVIGTNCTHLPEIGGIVVNAHDVTALVEAKRSLEEKNQELEHFTSMLTNRENKMVELKQEIARLKEELKAAKG